jgi:hypothetical protein
MMKKTIPLTNRRKFLLGAGLGTAGVAAALVARPGAAAKHADATDAPGPGKDGYRATDHVLKYYKTTKV